jgi:CubicO group peptidase (beta-lactamase class C family)
VRRLGAALVWAGITPVLTAVFLCACTASVRTSGLPEQLDAVFQKWNRSDAPGCVVGIERHDKPAVIRAYGSADLEHGVPIDAGTVFEAGSVSKQFTAASVLILVEQGKLSLTDDIRRYLPELPGYAATITISQLLDHTSGLRDWEGVVEIAGAPVTTRVYSVNDVLEIAARQKQLNHPPGTEFSYTNTGYILLTKIVERASGESFAQFGSEHLFQPMGMTHTQWRDDFRRTVKGRAVAYDAGTEGYHQLMPFENVIGSGGLLTTVKDLLKWNRALDDGKLGDFVTTQLQRRSALLDGRALSYARGLEVGAYHGVRKIWHTGETGGYESFLARYPDQHVSIALLCNAGQEVSVDALGDKAADLVLPNDMPNVAAAAPAAIKLGDEQLQQYAGDYFDPRFVVRMRLEVKDGALHRATDGLVFLPAAQDAFRTPISTLRFVDGEHCTREFDDGRKWEFQRIKPWHPQGAELSGLAGRYRSEEAKATYFVEVVDGQLRIALDDRRWDTADLDPVSVDVFIKPHHAYRFVRDAQGRVSSLEISNGWEHVYGLSFQRLADGSAH